MKKKIIIIASCAIFICILAVIISQIIDNEDHSIDDDLEIPDNKVVVFSWDNIDVNNWYEIFSAEVSSINWDLVEPITYFSSSDSIDEIANSNKESYLGDITYYQWDNKYDAKLFFNDNNYYVLYKNGMDYVVTNCFSSFNMDGEELFFQCPVKMYIDNRDIEMLLTSGINVFDILYDNYSFEQACEFYNRISKDIVSIDKDNKTITVDACWKTYKDNYITMNFNNRSIMWTDSKGKKHENFGNKVEGTY